MNAAGEAGRLGGASAACTVQNGAGDAGVPWADDECGGRDWWWWDVVHVG